jgi:hypothetical protein
MIHFLVVTGVFDGPFYNPYKADDICFRQDWPGSTSRYVEFTFVSCASPHVPLADPIGADQETLSFEDVDRDGQAEAVVESSWYKCKFGGLGCYGAYRTVLRICRDCDEPIVVVSERNLPELEWE